MLGLDQETPHLLQSPHGMIFRPDAFIFGISKTKSIDLISPFTWALCNPATPLTFLVPSVHEDDVGVGASAPSAPPAGDFRWRGGEAAALQQLEAYCAKPGGSEAEAFGLVSPRPEWHLWVFAFMGKHR